jgi:hypothetical protein
MQLFLNICVRLPDFGVRYLTHRQRGELRFLMRCVFAHCTVSALCASPTTLRLTSATSAPIHSTLNACVRCGSSLRPPSPLKKKLSRHSSGMMPPASRRWSVGWGWQTISTGHTLVDTRLASWSRRSVCCCVTLKWQGFT